MSDKRGMAERSPALNVAVARPESPFARVTGRTTLMRVVRLAACIALSGIALVIAVRAYYPRFLYPAPHRDASAPGSGKLLTLTARDGVTVHATELIVRSDAPVLVYFHGNGVAMGDVLWMAREFMRRGLSVVLTEYRGYGLSAQSGDSMPSENGLYEDAEAVLDALAAKGIGPSRIALFGESLGTGVAVEMAARGRGSSLILVTPYTSIPEVASRFVFRLPVRWLMRESFDSLAKAPSINLPTLLIHGTSDEVVPYAMSTRLAPAFPNARLITINSGHHNDLFLGEGWRRFDEVAAFVRNHRR
ncbi:MAG TPA: alpha/beta hydrolase [Polyangiaceae bacterium]|nr:alpha/beta hydrolase [Polyangiaceae bacterium]